MARPTGSFTCTPQITGDYRRSPRACAVPGAGSAPGSSRSSTSAPTSTRGAANCSRSPASTRLAPMRPFATTPRRSMPPLARATPCPGCLRRATHTRRCFTCSRTSSRLLGGDAAHARAGNGLAFRLKLLLAAGIVPHLAACAACGESEHLQGFSAAAGGIVCTACEASAFPLDEESYRFLVDALGRPLAQAPDASGTVVAPGGAGDHRDRRAPRERPPAAAAPERRPDLDVIARAAQPACLCATLRQTPWAARPAVRIEGP